MTRGLVEMESWILLILCCLMVYPREAHPSTGPSIHYQYPSSVKEKQGSQLTSDERYTLGRLPIYYRTNKETNSLSHSNLGLCGETGALEETHVGMGRIYTELHTERQMAGLDPEPVRCQCQSLHHCATPSDPRAASICKLMYAK